MTLAFIIDTVLTSSLLIFFLYACFATLALCAAYFIDVEIRAFLDDRREKRELLERTARPMDSIVDEIYES